MSIPKGAKPRAELMKISATDKHLLSDYAEARELAVDLRNDLANVFPGYILQHSISLLVEHIQAEERAFAKIRERGFTLDDVFALAAISEEAEGAA